MSDENIAIKVDNISKSFKLPHERHSSMKSRLTSIRKVKRGFEIQKVLDNISFEVNKGEFFGIVGRNGSGKSTLLKTIAQIYTPDSGGITVNGKLVPFIELGVGFNPELTGRENVYLNGALLGFNRKEVQAMYKEIVEFAELEKFMDQKLKNYSSGMQVRLAFSIAIRAKGDILLLDEVLAVGDSSFQQKCFDYFEKLKQEKKTIILVTHNMESVKRFCSRALLLEDGVIKLIGSPEEVADQYLLDNIDTKEKTDGLQKKLDETQKFTESVKELSLRLNSKKSLSSGDELKFTIKYKLSKKFNPALAFTIKKDGISVAEMNTLSIKIPSKTGISHTVDFQSPLKAFNPGVYKIDIAVINGDNRTLMAFKLKTEDFIITGHDETRGGPINLDGEWLV